MKKILLLIAAASLLMGTVSCGNEDEPRHGSSVTTVTYPMFNFITSNGGNTVVGIFDTQNELVLDTINHKATLKLNYTDSQGSKQLSIDDAIATPKRDKYYELSSPTYRSLKGYADFNQLSFRYSYTTTGGLHVISMTPEVFFLKTKSTVTYDDTTKASSSEAVMYQFDIIPGAKTANVTVGPIVHEKDVKHFNFIKSYSVPITLTPSGFTITGTNLATKAQYISYDFSTGSSVKETDQYPFKTFNATVDLINDSLTANFMMGGSATVTATGTTY